MAGCCGATNQEAQADAKANRAAALLLSFSCGEEREEQEEQWSIGFDGRVSEKSCPNSRPPRHVVT